MIWSAAATELMSSQLPITDVALSFTSHLTLYILQKEHVRGTTSWKLDICKLLNCHRSESYLWFSSLPSCCICRTFLAMKQRDQATKENTKQVSLPNKSRSRTAWTLHHEIWSAVCVVPILHVYTCNSVTDAQSDRLSFDRCAVWWLIATTIIIGILH